MKRPVECFSDLLECLQGGLEVFQHPVRDLAFRYGGTYEADTVFILKKLAEFAGRSGETLDEALAFYRSYIEQVVEERQELLRSSGRPGTGGVPWDDRFKRDYLYALTLSTVLNRSRYELLHDFRQTLAQHGAGAGRISGQSGSAATCWPTTASRWCATAA